MRDERLARRSHELLKQAFEVDAGTRLAFVHEQCGSDPKLLKSVLALLKALDHSTDFLEAPALGEPKAAANSGAIDIGREIAGYRIVRVIGVGGMARVYEAMQQRPNRRVALKVMNHGMTGTSAVQRFHFETEVLARLRHPNIAQIHEVGSIDDGLGFSIPFFAMEYIAGAQPITAFAGDRSLTLHERLALCAVSCDAVQYGHQNGIIHRDLKPGNVLVDAAGHLKIIDFGIARSTDPEQVRITQHAEPGQLIGTLNYMSPEQCAGSSDLDVRTDVFSLGMILYELACGRLPHDLTRVPVPEALRIVQHESPTRPGAVRPELSGDVEAIILKAIDKDPDRRYRTAAALAADLQRFLRHEAIEARPPTLLYQARLFARRHRPTVLALLAIALSVLLALALSTWFAVRASQELELRKKAEKEMTTQRDAAVWRAYVANMSSANSAVRTGELQLARRNLGEAPEIHRNWEWSFLNETAEQSAQTIHAHDDLVFAFDASRDGSRFATGSRDGTIRIWDAASRTVIAETDDHGAWYLSIAFSPDGTRIVSGSTDRTVRMWDTATGRELHLGAHGNHVESVSFSALGVIASASEDGVGLLWDGNTGQPLGQLSPQPGGITGVAFTRAGDRLLTWNQRGVLWIRSADDAQVLHELTFPGSIYCATTSHDDRIVAVGGSRGQVVLWDTQSGAMLHPPLSAESPNVVRALAFAPGDGVLASGHGDRQIRLWSVSTGKLEPLQFRGHEGGVSGLAFTSDGGQLVSSSWDRTLRIWEIAQPQRLDPVTTLAGHENRVIGAVFSPDGSMLASSSIDRTIRLWDPELGTPIGALRGHTGAVFAVAFSPDGRRLASGSHDRTIRLWNARTGIEEAVLKGHTGHLWSVVFSPDGRSLASGGNDGIIRIWDVESRRETARLEGHSNRVTCVRFSPDGRQLASASRDHSVRLWDIASTSLVFTRSDHELDVFAVEFNADGSRLYSGCRDQTVRVWDPATGECLHVLSGHGQFVTSLSINPAGDRLAAGSWYGEILLWDLATMDLVISFKGHEEVIRGVSFGPEGRWLASASYDGTVRLFDAAPREERLRLRREAEERHQEASSIVDRLFKELGSLERVVEAVDAGRACESSLVPWVRKQMLMRSLGGEGVDAPAP